MKEQIKKAMQHNQVVDIMYIAKNNTLTKRRIKLIKIVDDAVQAYCFTRHAKRTFKFDNILAAYPVLNRASGLRKLGISAMTFNDNIGIVPKDTGTR
ncbi:transcriptional regulator [Solibacillus sp. FSL W8-0372]|uniref:transcriptional regulator n=1 Tax=Solibacillus sp. FSL W8-0372 TaxID=2921713 RepID=UPI0030D3B0F1